MTDCHMTSLLGYVTGTDIYTCHMTSLLGYVTGTNISHSIVAPGYIRYMNQVVICMEHLKKNSYICHIHVIWL
jgi:hypothetical protein